MAIALLGGAFDPPHNQHLAIAHKAMADYSLDRVIFVPLNQPPHKEFPLVSPAYRLAMVQLAIEHEPRFSVSDCEIQRGGISYTIDTVRVLNPQYLIVGEDAYSGLSTWKDPEALCKLIQFIIIPRTVEVSSTMVRALVARGASLKGLVPEAVVRYIREHALYQ